MTGDQSSNSDVVYADIWDRLWANLIDNLILGILFYGGFLALGIDLFLVALVSITIGVFYLFGLEGVYNNQTIGKYLLKIKVATHGDGQVGMLKSFTRNFIGVIGQAFAIWGLIVGAILITWSDKNKRLGDKIAGTIVVKTG